MNLYNYSQFIENDIKKVHDDFNDDVFVKHDNNQYKGLLEVILGEHIDKFGNKIGKQNIEYVKYTTNESSHSGKHFLKFNINKNEHIGKIYLQIEFDNYENFLNILDTKIYFSKNCYTLINSTTILHAIFDMVCMGYNINFDDNKAEIIIFDFESDIISQSNELIFSGFDTFGNGQIYDLCIKIHTLKSDNIKFKIIVNHIYYPNTIYRNKSNKILNNINANIYIKDKVYYSAKCIVIVSLSLSPISIVTITHDIDKIIDYYCENMLTMEMMNHILYIIPFCEEFNSWENINKFYNDKYAYFANTNMDESIDIVDIDMHDNIDVIISIVTNESKKN